MLEVPEDQGGDDGQSMVIVGPQGPPGQESPTAQMPKRSPPSYNTQGGLRKRRRGVSNQSKPLPNKPQDLQVEALGLSVSYFTHIQKVLFASISSCPGSCSSHRGATVTRHQHQTCCQGNRSRSDQEDPHKERQQPLLWWGKHVLVSIVLVVVVQPWNIVKESRMRLTCLPVSPSFPSNRCSSSTSLRHRPICLINHSSSLWVWFLFIRNDFVFTICLYSTNKHLL